MKILTLKQHEPPGLLAGTTTLLLRRVVPTMSLPKIAPLTMEPWIVEGVQETDEHGAPCWIGTHPEYPREKWFSPSYTVGDVVWCQEEWSYHAPHGDCSGRVYAAQYVVPESQRPKNQTWQPASRMPKWMSRLTLEIVSVAVVQVASLTDEQVYATGLFDRTWTHVDNNVHTALMHAWETVYGGGVWAWAIGVCKV